MAISEQARHDLYQALEQAIGHEQAGALMGGRTYDDRFEARFAAIDARFDRLTGDMHRQFGEVHMRIAEWGRTIVLANVATMVAAVSLAFAASRL